jgi:hypothetical protein
MSGGRRELVDGASIRRAATEFLRAVKHPTFSSEQLACAELAAVNTSVEPIQHLQGPLSSARGRRR